MLHFSKKQSSLLGLLLSCSLAFAMEVPENTNQNPVQLDLQAQPQQAAPQGQSLFQRISNGISQLQNSGFVCRTIPSAIIIGALTYYAPHGNSGVDKVRQFTLASALSYIALSEGSRLCGTLASGLVQRYTGQNREHTATNNSSGQNAEQSSYCTACHKPSTKAMPTMLIPCHNKHNQHYHAHCLAIALRTNNNKCPACDEPMTIVPIAVAPCQQSQIKNYLKKGLYCAGSLGLIVLISKLDLLKGREIPEWMKIFNFPKESVKEFIKASALDTTAVSTIDNLANRAQISPATARALAAGVLILLDPWINTRKNQFIIAIFGHGSVGRAINATIPTPGQYYLSEGLSAYAQNISRFASSYQDAIVSTSLPLTIMANAISMRYASLLDSVLTRNTQNGITNMIAVCIDLPFLTAPLRELSDSVNDQLYFALIRPQEPSAPDQVTSSAPTTENQTGQTEEEPAACIICLEGNATPENAPLTTNPAQLLSGNIDINAVVQGVAHIAQEQIEQALASTRQTATESQEAPSHALVVIPCEHYHPERIHPECLMGMQESGRTFTCPLCRAPFATTFGLINESPTEPGTQTPAAPISDTETQESTDN